MLYLEACRVRGLETDINSTFFGKLVKKAFPGIQYNRFAASPCKFTTGSIRGNS
jgi:hypothetical protein